MGESRLGLRSCRLDATAIPTIVGDQWMGNLTGGTDEFYLFTKMCRCLGSQIAIWDSRRVFDSFVGATSPVTRPWLAMGSRYFGTRS